MKTWEQMRQEIRNNPNLTEKDKAFLLRDIDEYEAVENRYNEMTQEEKEQHDRDLNDMIIL